MFENLLGQDEVIAQLRLDLETERLPKSILLSGPIATGKLTAALELARVLSCQAEGQARGLWNCACPSCSRHRILAHPDLLLMGPRSFPEEIPAALSLLERAPGKASAYFFIRAIRKLGKRFDTALFDGEESRLAKAAPLLRDIEERLDLLSPDDITGTKRAEAGLEAARAVAETAKKLENLVPDTTPVFQIRSAEYWARLAPNGKKKTIVIENADRMLEASRNALLKILEEPPESLEFVLVSPRRRALMATILSRLRPYDFKARSEEEEALVLERIFKAPLRESGPRTKASEAAGARRRNSIEAYLAAERAFPPDEALRRARGFLFAVVQRRKGGGNLDPALLELGEAVTAAGGKLLDVDPALAALADSGASPREIGDAALAAIAAATKDFGQKDDAFASSFQTFLKAMAEILGESLRLPGLGPDGLFLLENWAGLLRDLRSQYETYNLSPSLLVESLLYAMSKP